MRFGKFFRTSDRLRAHSRTGRYSVELSIGHGYVAAYWMDDGVCRAVVTDDTAAGAVEKLLTGKQRADLAAEGWMSRLTQEFGTYRVVRAGSFDFFGKLAQIELLASANVSSPSALAWVAVVSRGGRLHLGMGATPQEAYRQLAKFVRARALSETLWG